MVRLNPVSVRQVDLPRLVAPRWRWRSSTDPRIPFAGSKFQYLLWNVLNCVNIHAGKGTAHKWEFCGRYALVKICKAVKLRQLRMVKEDSIAKLSDPLVQYSPSGTSLISTSAETQACLLVR